jgi:hypothetical protein
MYKIRGSRVAVQGRSRVGTRLVTQLTVGDGDEDNDEGIVRHKLPAKKRKKAKPHCLNDAVLANKRSVKKK